MRSAPNACILPKEMPAVQGQARSRPMRRQASQPKRDKRDSERQEKSKFRRRKRGKYILQLAGGQYTLHLAAAPRRRDPLALLALFAGWWRPPWRVCGWQGIGKTVEEQAAGMGCVWYGWDMAHVLGWGLRISTVGGLAAVVPVTTPAWRVLWLQWERDFYVWAMVGDGGCSVWIDSVPDEMRFDIDLPRFINDITPGDTLRWGILFSRQRQPRWRRAETAGSRWRHDDVSHPLLSIIAASTIRLSAVMMHTLLRDGITTKLCLASERMCT
ncbi:hypothetical protein B0T18DRAFT_96611 [Schizothecium vesticola]|uniref:Uncharacterized protein n=1 Tax=Schizothecium vesticola TaxID=314040 RepID=A0AA40K7U6_9PEZI|nr:hypothetical protein B0T18DRAFT_96611 [Schizothecium vesticola]